MQHVLIHEGITAFQKPLSPVTKESLHLEHVSSDPLMEVWSLKSISGLEEKRWKFLCYSSLIFIYLTTKLRRTLISKQYSFKTRDLIITFENTVVVFLIILQRGREAEWLFQTSPGFAAGVIQHCVLHPAGEQGLR